MGDEAQVRAYANRMTGLLLGVVGAAFCALGVWMYLDHTRPPVTANPWEYEEPGRTIVSISLVVVFGAGTLIALYWVLTPLPMFELDAMGMTYRVPPFKWSAVRWDDIASITASKQVYNWPWRFNTRLTLRITLTQGAAVAQVRKSKVKLAVAQELLAMSVEELVWRIRQHHAVTLSGFAWRDPH